MNKRKVKDVSSCRIPMTCSGNTVSFIPTPP